MSNDSERDFDLHPDPTPAEREAVRVALASPKPAHAPCGSPVSAWQAAGLQESVERDPQEAVSRSNRGATRA